MRLSAIDSRKAAQIADAEAGGQIARLVEMVQRERTPVALAIGGAEIHECQDRAADAAARPPVQQQTAAKLCDRAAPIVAQTGKEHTAGHRGVGGKVIAAGEP
ncbi:hypothetical protein WPS_12520 [Vulcanimicrobium alpinum]|uniref:Uncharacterized protein n=1 Tax=Vulcanimicrobium alpinum TaxID=3016050 RepID=A0AAN1XWR3_UNVUL|nr:hypothetical protein WPS_12520 [Vulcanimicrobium alpinum]